MVSVYTNISGYIVLAASLLQLFHVMQKNKTMYAPTFLMYSVSGFMKTYEHYMRDGDMSSQLVLFSLANSIVLFLIYALLK
jgi:hypothetical protein